MRGSCFSILCSSFTALFLLPGGASAASVGPTGYTNDFSTQPPAADWATFARSGFSGETYDMDSDVNATITASGVTSQTMSNAGDPAAFTQLATWSSTGHYLQTRPSGVRYTALMGKFVNDSGINATQVTVSYLFTVAGQPNSEDTDKGTRVYYSLTGLANSWTNLAALNVNSSTNLSLALATDLALDWPIGAPFYLLWVDDNGIGSPDPANQIDNFSLQTTAGAPLACVLTTPTNGARFVSGAPILGSAVLTNGTAPFRVEYFTNSGVGNALFSSAGSSGTAPYNVSLGALRAGTWNVYAVATDSADSPVSARSQTNTFFVSEPISLTLTAPSDGATFNNASDVSGSASVSGGTAPYSVQFYVDDLATGEAVTSAPYSRNLGALFVGDHSIRATVSDAAGWMSNSLISIVHITGPLGVRLAPTNGTSYIYGQAATLTAAPGGGTAPYSVTFYINEQVVGLLSSSPFTTNLGVLPVGSYTSYVRVTDSATPTPQQNYSTTNTFTILANPLTVNLTSPSNGQSTLAGSPFQLTAAPRVGAPITINSVEFFLDGLSAGLDSTAPYSSSVSPVVGSHTVYARAVDSLGRFSYSATNQLLVTPISITSALANDLATVVVTFSDPVDPAAAANPGYYSFSPSLTVTGIQLLNSSTVLIRSSPRDPLLSFTIRAGGSEPVPILRRNRNTLGGLAGIQTVFIVLFENHSWSAIKDSPNAPYMNSLLPQSSYCEQYYAYNDQHPSEPNYITLEAGTNFGIFSDAGPAFDRISNTNHLVTLLNNAGIDWRGYMESMPVGTTGTTSSGEYVGRHNPFAFFDDVTTDYNYATNHIRPYSYFAADLAAGQIGRYNFITPNLINDMHDGSVLQGDTWLAQELPAILSSPAFANNGAVFLTFDESGGGGPIMMMVLSPLAKGGGYASTTFYDHTSTVRTMQDIFGVGPYLAEAANTSNLGELFLNPTLTIVRANGVTQLTLSEILAGNTNYFQASSDLIHWTTIGSAVADEANETLTISDLDQSGPRFYRVVEAP
jgi:hypothetical protein